jgi:lipopolysaccharide export system protein LptC
MNGRSATRAIAARGNLPSLIADWLARLPGNRYSRRVALLKLVLPAIGLSLLLLVVAWPRISPLFDRLRFAAIDLREARELRMMNPRYAGTDRDGRPFVVTASIGRQVPQRDDLMALDQPEADLKSHSGASIVVTADSGVYQTQSQFLDAFGHVTVTHENGTRIVTNAARLDVANNAAEGHEPVEGHGPSGDIAAQGFRVIDHGEVVVFTGRSDLLLKGNNGNAASATATPASLPAPVAQAAALIETKEQPKAPARPAAARVKPAPHQAVKAHPKPVATKRPG